MGKNRHSKDKLYIVASEYARSWGGGKPKTKSLPFRCLPFDCCGLSLLPFTDPVCTKEGIVFDAQNIKSYIAQYQRNPVTGETLKLKDLFPLTFHKNTSGKYHCPVTYKEFNNYSHIIANVKSSHVYSNDAIETLCRKPKNWLDLITNEPFTPSDLVSIQNPKNVDMRKIEDFNYVKLGRTLDTSIQVESEPGSLIPVMHKSQLATKVVQEAGDKTEDAIKVHQNKVGNKSSQEESSKKAEKSQLFTTHRQAASFTSTGLDVVYQAEFKTKTDADLREDLYRIVRKMKKNGYVRLVTSLGYLNFELYCSKAPETCHNFLNHCESGYYNDTIFHRCIPNFMIQGGDPTGTGCGGKSSFKDGAPFRDECGLSHNSVGILSMANAGRNTNKSQFFITFGSCTHLDRMHSVFGKLVGGMDTLERMKNLKIGKEDRPEDPPVIKDAIVFENPFKTALEKKEEDAENEKKRKNSEAVYKKLENVDLLNPMKNHAKRNTDEIGKYANFESLKKMKAF